MPESSEPIVWRIHLASPPARVFEFLATGEGRARFWAESALEMADGIEWRFANGIVTTLEIVASEPPARFAIRYFGRSIASFTLVSDDAGGTDLTLQDEGVPAAWREETLAGWVSVLLSLKAAADFGVDLRNHDPDRTRDERYVDN